MKKNIFAARTAMLTLALLSAPGVPAASGTSGLAWAKGAETGPNISGESAAADHFESGTNISGENSAADNPRTLIRQDAGQGLGQGYRQDGQIGIPQDPSMRIDVPRMPDGRPWRPVRGLSRTEKMEMDDLEHRFQQGQLSEAEYYSRRNALMERLGMQAEY